MLPLGLVVVGAAPPEVKVAHGTYEAWFSSLAERFGARVVARDLPAGETMDPREVAGIVITGSPASLTEPEPWMDVARDVVIGAKDHGTPVLGVCFGHQLIGVAAGGAVIENPAGYEYATQSATQTPRGLRDPLFVEVGTTFECNQAHRDIIDPETLPSCIEVLASNPKCAVQALAWGETVRGVQFHPEFTGAITACYLELRREILADDAAKRGGPSDRPEQLQCRSTPQAEKIFGNFVREFVAKG